MKYALCSDCFDSHFCHVHSLVEPYAVCVSGPPHLLAYCVCHVLKVVHGYLLDHQKPDHEQVSVLVISPAICLALLMLTSYLDISSPNAEMWPVPLALKNRYTCPRLRTAHSSYAASNILLPRGVDDQTLALIAE